MDQLEKFTYSLEINPSGKFKVSSIMSYFTCIYSMLSCEHGLDPYCISAEFSKLYSIAFIKFSVTRYIRKNRMVVPDVSRIVVSINQGVGENLTQKTGLVGVSV